MSKSTQTRALAKHPQMGQNEASNLTTFLFMHSKPPHFGASLALWELAGICYTGVGFVNWVTLEWDMERKSFLVHLEIGKLETFYE
jgi:hypothetical protein